VLGRGCALTIVWELNPRRAGNSRKRSGLTRWLTPFSFVQSVGKLPSTFIIGTDFSISLTIRIHEPSTMPKSDGPNYQEKWAVAVTEQGRRKAK